MLTLLSYCLACHLLNSATRYPKVMNAPGGNTKRRILVVSGNSVNPKKDPAPISSRTVPSSVSAQVNPRPMPNPSHMETKGVFLQAKLSARPSTIQLTTISGIYMPSA